MWGVIIQEVPCFSRRYWCRGGDILGVIIQEAPCYGRKYWCRGRGVGRHHLRGSLFRQKVLALGCGEVGHHHLRGSLFRQKALALGGEMWGGVWAICYLCCRSRWGGASRISLDECNKRRSKGSNNRQLQTPVDSFSGSYHRYLFHPNGICADRHGVGRSAG